MRSTIARQASPQAVTPRSLLGLVEHILKAQIVRNKPNVEMPRVTLNVFIKSS